MKLKVIGTATALALICSSILYAHSGRTDSSGGALQQEDWNVSLPFRLQGIEKDDIQTSEKAEVPDQENRQALKEIALRSWFISIALSLFAVTACVAAEKDYQYKWCSNHHGITEYRLPDSTRVDCLTNTHAIEFDYAKKWAEAVGQSLHYSLMTGKRPGVVIIIEKESDVKHLRKLVPLVLKYDIELWLTFPSDL